jgi:hypothetical protein
MCGFVFTFDRSFLARQILWRQPGSSPFPGVFGSAFFVASVSCFGHVTGGIKVCPRPFE